MAHDFDLGLSMEPTALCVIDDIGRVVVERAVARYLADIERCIVDRTRFVGRRMVQAIGDVGPDAITT